MTKDSRSSLVIGILSAANVGALIGSRKGLRWRRVLCRAKPKIALQLPRFEQRRRRMWTVNAKILLNDRFIPCASYADMQPYKSKATDGQSDSPPIIGSVRINLI